MAGLACILRMEESELSMLAAYTDGSISPALSPIVLSGT